MRMLSKLLGVGNFFVAAYSMEAALLTYDSPTPAVYWSDGYYVPPGSGAFNFQQFDPSLGTLNSVTIELQGSIDDNYLIEGPPGAQGISTLVMTMGVQDAGNSLNSSVVMTFSQPYTIPDDGSGRVAGLAEGAATAGSTYYSSTILNEFIGAGMIKLPGFSSLVIQQSPDNANGFPYEPVYDLYGSVIYDYTTTVPEPVDIGLIGGLLALFVGGVSGIGGLRSRCQRPS